jgi:hypothetical protein
VWHAAPHFASFPCGLLAEVAARTYRMRTAYFFRITVRRPSTGMEKWAGASLRSLANAAERRLHTAQPS